MHGGPPIIVVKDGGEFTSGILGQYFEVGVDINRWFAADDTYRQRGKLGRNFFYHAGWAVVGYDNFANDLSRRLVGYGTQRCSQVGFTPYCW